MRILVYEPGTAGHRSVFLRYIMEAFAEAGCETVVVTEDYQRRPLALVRLARRQGCKILFVCTLDGLREWLLVLGLGSRIAGIRVAGIYYLFNNLYEGWKGSVWRCMLKSGLVEAAFVPDLLFARNVPRGMAGKIVPIADAWDSRQLLPMPRTDALQQCGYDDPRICMILLFGAIARRKGVEQILTSLETWDSQERPNLRVVLAGRFTEEIKGMLALHLRKFPGSGRILRMEDRWVAEDEVSKYFSAAAYLCSLYPKYFKVSMSTVIKAFALRRPALVGRHGMMGEIVGQRGAGLVCDTDSPTSVIGMLERAYDIYNFEPKVYSEMSNAGREIARLSELSFYKATLSDWVRRVAADHSY